MTLVVKKKLSYLEAVKFWVVSNLFNWIFVLTISNDCMQIAYSLIEEQEGRTRVPDDYISFVGLLADPRYCGIYLFWIPFFVRVFGVLVIWLFTLDYMNACWKCHMTHFFSVFPNGCVSVRAFHCVHWRLRWGGRGGGGRNVWTIVQMKSIDLLTYYLFFFHFTVP